jgi:hypothetical protein
LLRWVVTGIALLWLGFGLWVALSGFQMVGQQPRPDTAAQAWCRDHATDVAHAAVDLGIIDEDEVDDTVDALVAAGNLGARQPADYRRACEAAFELR